MTKPDARAQLRARFPESEGWGVCVVRVVPNANRFIAEVRRNGVSAWAEEDGDEAAATALISAWDAATHAEKVRGLVRRVEEVQSIAEDRGDVQDGPEGQPVPNSWMVMGTMLREALAALPEHWKEGVRGK